eukprot:627482-Pelagomonas_calceolata.AAC.3
MTHSSLFCSCTAPQLSWLTMAVVFCYGSEPGPRKGGSQVFIGAFYWFSEPLASFCSPLAFVGLMY